MRISDWSSDVCSSDLPADVELRGFAEDDAVLVEQEDGAGRRDGSEDMARVDIHDLVESDITDRLVEHHRGIHADAEGVPVDHRPRVAPVDRHAPGAVAAGAPDAAQYYTPAGRPGGRRAGQEVSSAVR